MLENENIKLRALEPEDLELLYLWENKSEWWYAGELRVPYSKFALKQFVLSASNDIYESKQLRFVVELKKEGEPIGLIDLFDFDFFNQRVAVGLLVAEPFRKKGIASQSLALIEEYVFKFLGINQIYAHVAENNVISKKFFESCRFEKNGVFKQWIRHGDSFVDVVLYQLFK